MPSVAVASGGGICELPKTSLARRPIGGGADCSCEAKRDVGIGGASAVAGAEAGGGRSKRDVSQQ